MKAEELKKEAESAALEADLDSFSDWISHEFMTEHLDEEVDDNG